MNRQIIGLLITLLTASEAISQTSKDTTCLPNEQLKKVVNRIEYCKVLEQELIVSRDLISGQKAQLSNKDSIIASQKEQAGTYDKLINNSLEVEKRLRGMIDVQKEQLLLTNKLLRKEKRKKYATAIIGLILGFLIAK